MGCSFNLPSMAFFFDRKRMGEGIVIGQEKGRSVATSWFLTTGRPETEFLDF